MCVVKQFLWAGSWNLEARLGEVLTAARLAPKTIVNVVTVVKFIVASAVDEEGDQIHPRVWNYEFMQLPLVVREKQNRPTITEAEISAMLTALKGRDAVLVALVAGTGLRIGEALAIRTDDFDPLCRSLQVRRSVWRRREQAPKTLNAIRPVDIPESLAQDLCRYIKGRKGHLFTTRRLLDSRNVLDVLRQAGRQGGYHAFRRFRFAVLRRAGVPDDLIKLWLGHSQNLIDLYAAQLRYDETYRREWREKAGSGFELGELGYKFEAPIRPLLVA
jgi:integrase